MEDEENGLGSLGFCWELTRDRTGAGGVEFEGAGAEAPLGGRGGLSMKCEAYPYNKLFPSPFPLVRGGGAEKPNCSALSR